LRGKFTIDGAPQPSMQVFTRVLLQPPIEGRIEQWHSVMAAADGTFVLDGCPGLWNVHGGWPAGQLFVHEPFAMAAGDDVTRDFELRAAKAQLRLLDHDGRPLARASLELFWPDGRSRQRLASTDADGRAVPALVEAQAFEVRVHLASLPEALRAGLAAVRGACSLGTIDLATASGDLELRLPARTTGGAAK